MARRDPAVGLTEPACRPVARGRGDDGQGEGARADGREQEGQHRLDTRDSARGEGERSLLRGPRVGSVIARHARDLPPEVALPERPSGGFRAQRGVHLRECVGARTLR